MKTNPRTKLSLLECFVLVALVAMLLQGWRSSGHDWNDAEQVTYFTVAGGWCGGYLLGRGLIRRGLLPTAFLGMVAAAGVAIYYSLPWPGLGILAAAAAAGGAVFGVVPWIAARIARAFIAGEFSRIERRWWTIAVAVIVAAAGGIVWWQRPWSAEPRIRHWSTRQLAVPAVANVTPLGFSPPGRGSGLGTASFPRVIAPDGRKLIMIMPDPRRRDVSSRKRDVVTLDTRSGWITSRALAQEDDPNRRLYDVAISPSGKSVALLYPWLSKLYIIDSRTGRTRWEASPTLHPNPTRIAFLDENRVLAIGFRHKHPGLALTREVWSVGNPVPVSTRTNAWTGAVRCHATTAAASHAIICDDAPREWGAAALWSCDGPVNEAGLHAEQGSSLGRSRALHLFGRWCACGESLWNLDTGQRTALSGKVLGFLRRYNKLLVGESNRLAPSTNAPPPWADEIPFLRIWYQRYDRAVNLALVDLDDLSQVTRSPSVRIRETLGSNPQFPLEWHASDDCSTVVAVDDCNHIVVWRIGGWGW